MATNPPTKGKPKASLIPEGSKLVLLFSSTSGSLEVRARQGRVQSIIDGLHLVEGCVSLFDGASATDPDLKRRRLELFVLSGSTAQYPQLFLERPDASSPTGVTTQYVGNADEIFALHDSNTLGDVIGLVVHESVPEEDKAPAPSTENEPVREPGAGEAAEEESAPPTMDLDLATFVTKPPDSSRKEDSAAKEVAAMVGDKDTTVETSWVRQPSTRHFNVTKAADAMQKEISVDILQRYKGSPPHEWAALKIQRITRLLVLPIFKLQTKIQSVKDKTAKDVQKIQKDTQKRIAKIQKQFDKDCKQVDKLAKDIRRQQKKQKSLKKDIKAEKKLRDHFTKPRDKELKRQEKHTKRLKRYKKKVEQEQKHLEQWDKDIKAVQQENGRLLSAITNISEKLAVSGVNWTELMKADENADNVESMKKGPAIDKNEATPKGTGSDLKQGEPSPGKASSATTARAAPLRVPPRGRLQSILRRQEARRSVVAMVREESQRFGKDECKQNAGELQPSPVYFVRLNSRARLVT